MSDRHTKREKLVTVIYQHLLLKKDLFECYNDYYLNHDVDGNSRNSGCDLFLHNIALPFNPSDRR